MAATPKALAEARKRLEPTLPKGMYVGTGFGYEPPEPVSSACWKLFVYTDNKDKSMVPNEFEGYPVVLRGVPKAGL